MCGSRPLSPERASAMGKIGGRVSQTRPDAAAQLATARDTFLTRFYEFDPDGVLPAETRERIARQLQSAYFRGLVCVRHHRAQHAKAEAAGV